MNKLPDELLFDIRLVERHIKGMTTREDYERYLSLWVIATSLARLKSNIRQLLAKSKHLAFRPLIPATALNPSACDLLLPSYVEDSRPMQERDLCDKTN